MRTVADGEVNSIKHAAAEAIGQLSDKLEDQVEAAVATLREEVQSSSQAVEQSKQQLASLAEAKLASLSQATQDEYAQRLAQALRDQTQEMHAAADGEVASIRQAAAEVIAELQGKLEQQAHAAVTTLREELQSSSQAVEQSKQQLASLAEAKTRFPQPSHPRRIRPAPSTSLARADAGDACGSGRRGRVDPASRRRGHRATARQA